MDALLEFVLTLVVEIVNAANFKRPGSCIWAMTGIFALLFAAIVGLAAWGTVTLFQQGGTAGTIVMGCITVASLIAAVMILVKGHKTGWERH